MNELWRDYSAHQDNPDTVSEINPQIAIDNGVVGFIFRSGTSWTYKDPTFNYLYPMVEGKAYRTSYHNFSPGADVDSQLDNWFAQHPTIDVIPRFAAVEGNYNNLEPYQIAPEFFKFSERYLERVGQRPGIYTRREIADRWLTPFLDEDFLNEHWWWIAQYDNRRDTEELDKPIIPPKGVLFERCWLKQTADLMPGFLGEAESGSVDRNRFQFKDMNVWINLNFKQLEPAPPVADPDIMAQVEKNTRDLFDLLHVDNNYIHQIFEHIKEINDRLDNKATKLDNIINGYVEDYKELDADLSTVEAEVERAHARLDNKATKAKLEEEAQRIDGLCDVVGIHKNEIDCNFALADNAWQLGKEHIDEIAELKGKIEGLEGGHTHPKWMKGWLMK